ncbi:MAG: M48 family metallopeptidase [archaeon]
MRRDKVVIGGKEYAVHISLEQRTGMRAFIGKTGIHLRIPAGMSREEQFRQIQHLKHWAIKKIEEKPPEFKQKGSRTYNDGNILRIGNEEYFIRLSFGDKKNSSAKAVGNTFHIKVSGILSGSIQQKHISVLLSRLVAKKKKAYIADKVRDLNEKHFSFKFKKIFLKYNTSNWGSCSHSGNINISTRLLFAPDDVIDYVCVHELAHLQERNHSPGFWKLVEQAMPDYKEKKMWLRENSDKCWF